MRMFGLILLVLVALLCQPLVVHADIYKWVSENGTVTFSDTPPLPGNAPKGKEATPAGPKQKKVEIKAPSGGAIRAEQVQRETPPPASDAVAAEPANFPPVELYVTSWCGYCRQAKAFLASRGVPFREFDIERDAEAARRMARLNSRGGVPVAVIGGKTVVGFSPVAYQLALGAN